MIKNSTDYKRKFNAEKYDRLEITVPKGKKGCNKRLCRKAE